MRVPKSLYALEAQLAEQLPALRPAQRRGLALWVTGTVLAKSASQSAVVAALVSLGGNQHVLRQRLREWLYDGAHRAAPCQVELDVAACMAPLLAWVLRISPALPPTDNLRSRATTIPRRTCSPAVRSLL